MQKFAILARSGFYATCIGMVGQAVVSVSSMAYDTAKLVEKAFFACLIAGFLLSLLAIITARSANVSLDKARSFYILAGLGLTASGCVLAVSCFTFLRNILGQPGISL